MDGRGDVIGDEAEEDARLLFDLDSVFILAASASSCVFDELPDISSYVGSLISLDHWASVASSPSAGGFPVGALYSGKVSSS